MLTVGSWYLIYTPPGQLCMITCTESFVDVCLLRFSVPCMFVSCENTLFFLSLVCATPPAPTPSL